VFDSHLERSEADRKNYLESNATLLERLASEGQDPEALLIVCSDSRIMPAHLLGAKPGQYFVFRNVANLVPPYWQTELCVSAVLEYAVCDLAVSDIIVCGHTDCGGIQALIDGPDISTRPGLSRWLDVARPALLSSEHEYGAQGHGSRDRVITEQNVANQLRNLRSYPYIRDRLAAGETSIHGWVYDLEEQDIRRLDFSTGEFVLD
jgi:carbonic anhydrase